MTLCVPLSTQAGVRFSAGVDSHLVTLHAPARQWHRSSFNAFEHIILSHKYDFSTEYNVASVALEMKRSMPFLRR